MVKRGGAKLPLKTVKKITTKKTNRRNASRAVSKKREVKRALLHAARQIPENSVPSELNSQSDTPTIVESTIGLPQQNDGEKGEAEVINFLNGIDNMKAVEIFGPDASDGIVASGVSGTNKAASKDKADIKVIMNKSKVEFMASVKRKDCKGDPTVMNMTRRDEAVFREGGILNNQVENLDMLIKSFNYTGRKNALSTSNKITRDAAHSGKHNSLEEVYLRDIFNDIDAAIAGQLQYNQLLPIHPIEPGNNNAKNDIQNAFIELMTYFLFQGAGGGDSANPANSMIIWDGKTKEVLFTDCRRPQEKKSYIENNINNFKICMQKKGDGSGKQWPEVLVYSKSEGKPIIKAGLAVRIHLGKKCPLKKSGVSKTSKTKKSDTRKVSSKKTNTKK